MIFNNKIQMLFDLKTVARQEAVQRVLSHRNSNFPALFQTFL